MNISEFQRLIEKIYFDKDSKRGLQGTFMWFSEEVGELASALREGSKKEKEEEFADVFAWLSTLASLSGIEMSEAVKKYADGCPSCKEIPCRCSEKI